MINDTLQLLLDVFVQGFAGILLARFLLQTLRTPLRNPIGAAVMSLTNFIVLPTRRYVPAVRQLDSASLLFAILVMTLYVLLMLSLQGMTRFAPLGLLALSLVKLLILTVYFLIGALIAQAVLSWTNPHTPLAPILHSITQRFLTPIQRVVPLVGNLDLSPLILLVVCQIVLRIPLVLLENLALRLL
ncbi:MAG: YggT family protein [Gallionella sp.]